MDQLLSQATIKAIADLGVEGLRSEEDVRPALAAAGIPEVQGESEVGGSDHSIWLFPAGPREDIQASLSALDLTKPDSVDKVTLFAARIAEIYAASKSADQAKLVRLRNALADDGYEFRMERSGMAGFSIDRRGIAQMMTEIQKEFDKHRINVPVNADPSVNPQGGTIIYNGPVINGNVHGGAQLAWNSKNVNQSQQNESEQIAPGFEPIAQAVAKTLEGLSAVGLDETEREAAESAGKEALAEVTQAEPDKGKLRNALAKLKGFLTPIALGLATGSAEGAQEWARTAIEQLGTAF